MIHTSADTLGNPPCIAGACYPNDDGTACAYCGLPAEPVTPAELADALTIETERTAAQIARAGGRQILQDYRDMTRGRSYSIHVAHWPGLLDTNCAQYARANRADRDAGANYTRPHWPIMRAAQDHRALPGRTAHERRAMTARDRTYPVHCHDHSHTYETADAEHPRSTSRLIGSREFGGLWHCPAHALCPTCPRGPWTDPDPRDPGPYTETKVHR